MARKNGYPPAITNYAKLGELITPYENAVDIYRKHTVNRCLMKYWTA